MPRAGLTIDNAAAVAASLTGQTGSGNLTVGLIAQLLGTRPRGITTLPGSGHDPQRGRPAPLAPATEESPARSLGGAWMNDSQPGLLTAARFLLRGRSGRSVRERGLAGSGFLGESFFGEVIQDAAPEHVHNVRQHFIDLFTPAELDTLAALNERILHHLAGEPLPGESAPGEPALSR